MLTLAVVSFSARDASALAPQIPRHSFTWMNLTAVQWNPLGLQTDLVLGYRYRLYNSQSMLFRNSFVSPFFITRVNPAFGRVGAGVTIQPIAAFRLQAQYEYRAYFGSFDMLQSWTSPTEDHGPDRREQRGDADENYLGTGHQLSLKATVRMKVGPIALLNDTTLFYFRMNLRPGDTVFYAALVDTVMPGKGWTVVNDANLVYVTRFGLIAGLRYSVIHAAYSKADYSGAAPQNINTPMHRLGAIAAYTFKSSRKRFQKPTVILIVNWWLRHRYRTGQEITQALPYGVVAFRVHGDLWTP